MRSSFILTQQRPRWRHIVVLIFKVQVFTRIHHIISVNYRWKLQLSTNDQLIDLSMNTISKYFQGLRSSICYCSLPQGEICCCFISLARNKRPTFYVIVDMFKVWVLLVSTIHAIYAATLMGACVVLIPLLPKGEAAIAYGSACHRPQFNTDWVEQICFWCQGLFRIRAIECSESSFKALENFTFQT